ncbi:MAG: hypothetical protein EP305_04330 [Bacteroidetes bacterium]|nr:MAG: hypothetical protein EP305_04330 [Bacteroidota bacterium]
MRIMIIGGGWLGKSLAKILKKYGFEVAITGRSRVIETEDLNFFQFDITDRESWSSIDQFDPEVVVICIPPLKSDEQLLFLEEFSALKLMGRRVIYTSSTGVYGSEGIFDEESFVEENGWIRKNEMSLLSNNAFFDLVILRLGGLIDQDRHPIYHLQGRKDLSDPNGVVNLVHRIDVIHAIQCLIDSNIHNGLYNVVNPDHPSREEYYTKMAGFLKLELPEFKKEKGNYKEVKGDKITQLQGFKYQGDIWLSLR